MSLEQKIKDAIRDVPDFPKPGIMFKDITPILHDAKLCSAIVDAFVEKLSGIKVDAIVGTESRGFLFGFLLANKMNIPFVLLRKSGKLPYKTHAWEYDLEYGKARVEMHIDALKPGWNILVHDDLLATGGTAGASAELVKMVGAQVAAFAFVVELGFLEGREKLKKYSEKIISLVSY
jgi:adenine phosphoribosyltransferase